MIPAEANVLIITLAVLVQQQGVQKTRGFIRVSSDKSLLLDPFVTGAQKSIFSQLWTSLSNCLHSQVGTSRTKTQEKASKIQKSKRGTFFQVREVLVQKKKKITFWNFELIRPKNVNYSLCNLCTKICVHRELFPQLNRIFYPFSHLSLNCIKRIFMYSYQCEITPHLLGLITFQYIINPVLIETSCHHVVNHNSTFFFPRSIFIVLRYITLCFKDPLIYQI